MTTFLRRAKAHIARVIASAADPAALASAAQLYGKIVAGVHQLFARDTSGEIFQFTPIFGPNRMSFYMLDDYLNSVTSNITNSGGSTVYTTAAAGSPGIIRNTVTAVGNRTALFPSSTADSTIIVGGSPIFFEGRCRTPTVQDAGDQWSDRWGLGDGPVGNDATDGVYFESDRATHGDNNVRLCCANGGVRTKTSMGVAPTANTFERWKLVINAAADSVQGYLNDTATGSAVVTNIPTAATAIWWIKVIKTAGANARTVDRDYVEIYQVFSTPR